MRNLGALDLFSMEPAVWGWPAPCSEQNVRGTTRLAFRIHRSRTPDAIVFALSGDMDQEHAARLHELLASETDAPVTLDLQNVTLVDRAAVQFLARAEADGIRIVNCPSYVRTWIAAERDSQPQPASEPDNQE